MSRNSVLARATQLEPQPEDQAFATSLSRAVPDATAITLRFPDGTELPLTPNVVKGLIALAAELSEGHAITLLASDVRLTPAEAGELLGLSRPFIVRLLDAGEIPSEHLPDSRHRMIRLADVLKFQAQKERHREGRRRIAEIVEDAGLPY